MPSSSCSIENELNYIFGGSVSHNVMLGPYYFLKIFSFSLLF